MTMDEGKYRFWTQEFVYGVVVVREGIAIADHEIETYKNSAHLDCKGMRRFTFLIPDFGGPLTPERSTANI